MQIIAVRHGETRENAEGIIQGQSFGTLTSRGHEQIAALAETLQHEQFDKAYCSDLERCKLTAAAIMQYHPKTPLEYDSRLRERSLKPLEGRPFAEVKWRKQEVHDLSLKSADGESWNDVRGRLVPFVDMLLNQPERRVLLITHGGPLRILDSLLDEQPLEKTIQHFYDNCAIRRWDVVATTGIEQ